MYTVGALAEWLTYRTEYLPVLLPIVIPGLRDPSLALTAVLTLKRITRECRFCECFTKGTLSIELVVAMRDALHVGHLKGQESGWLVQSIGRPSFFDKFNPRAQVTYFPLCKKMNA